jgi:iron complex outermembrane receptor protein
VIAGALLFVDGSLGAGLLEEVVVTARKREESVQDIPISVRAFGTEDLRTLQIRRANDITRFIPNVESSRTSESQINYYIRGVGDSNFHTNSVGAVGLYFDEVNMNSPVSSATSLFDMERVEVLRGPQNTLYGRNTTGGAINYISRKPVIGGDLNYRAEFTYGRKDEIDVEGAVGFPLGERAAARIAFLTQNRDGIFSNPTFGARNDIERHSGRVQIAWQPTTDLEVLANLHGGVDRGGNRPYLAIGTQDPNDPTMPCPVPLSELDENSPCVDGGGMPNHSDFSASFLGSPVDRNDIDVWGAFVKLSWDFLGLTFTSITSYDSNELRRAEDTDDTPSAAFEFHQTADVEQVSQDVRLESSPERRLKWIIGGNYFFEDSNYDTVTRRTPPGTPIGFYPPGTFTILPATIVDQENEVFSVYGQLEYEILESLTLEVGARYTDETKEGTDLPFVGNGSQFPIGTHLGEPEATTNPLVALPVADLDGDWDEWGGRVSLAYAISDNALAYGSVSRGFKGGGFSIAAFQVLQGFGARPVDPEILITYELGLKTEWFDRTLQANIAIFDNEWTNQQLFTLALLGGTVTPLLFNIPETRSYGLELETIWTPAEDWFIQLGLGLLDSEVQDATNVPAVRVGNELPKSPSFSINGLLRKEFQIGAGIFAAQLDFSYIDDYSNTIENQPEKFTDGYGLVNARASYAFGPNNRYEVAVWGRNLTDTEYCDTYGDLRGGIGESISCLRNDPLVTYGITASIFFE